MTNKNLRAVRIERKFDKEFNMESHFAYIGNQGIFTVDKYLLEKYAATHWKANYQKDISEFVKALRTFQSSLGIEFPGQDNSILETIVTNKPVEVNINGSKKSPICGDIDYENLTSKIESLSAGKCRIFSMQTALARFGLEMWPNRNNTMFVMSHKDISKPLSELIASTLDNHYDPKVLFSTLKEIYQFG